MGSLTYRHWTMAFCLFVLGALVVLEINDSPFLPAAHADSVEYMEAGQSMANGNGLALPLASWASRDSVSTLAHFPPGMSVAIGSIMKTTGVRKHVAALWLLALACGLSLGFAFLVGAVVGGWGAGLAAALLIGVMPPFVLTHTAVWSEPLYLVLVLVALFLMIRWPDRTVLLGAVAAASVMVRYLGLAVVVGAAAWTYLRTRSVRRAVLTAAPGTLAFGAWTLWTRNQGGAVRAPGEYTVSLADTLRELPGAIQFWLAPGLPLGAGLVILTGVVFAFWKAPRSLRAPLLLLVLTHLGVIGLSRLTIDVRIPFDARMLLPVFALAMLPPAVVLFERRMVGVTALLAWASLAGIEDVQGVRSLQANGSYYSSATWITSPLTHWVDNRSRGLAIYSNEPALMPFLCGRHARRLPLGTHDFDAFARQWRKRPGAIIVVNPMRSGELHPQVYQERLTVDVVHVSEHGVVFVPGAPGAGGQ